MTAYNPLAQQYVDVICVPASPATHNRPHACVVPLGTCHLSAILHIRVWGTACAGPLGQCHPIPDDPLLREQMLKHARNYERIYDMYNLPYQSAPGSDMHKAIEAFKVQLAARQKKLKRTQELEKRRLRRLEKRSGATASSSQQVGPPSAGAHQPVSPMPLHWHPWTTAATVLIASHARSDLVASCNCFALLLPFLQVNVKELCRCGGVATVIRSRRSLRSKEEEPWMRVWCCGVAGGGAAWERAGAATSTGG